MTPLDLSRAIEAALAASVQAGDLSLPAELRPFEITVERTKSQQHGDYATNIAMRLAKSVGRPPRVVAQTLVKYLEQAPGIAGVDVAGPGFLNITLEPAAQGELARTIWTEGARYGHNASLSGQRINLEFVSANPTGPVHIGSVRWAAVGDSLARILKSSGADVVREYYFNDHGAQIERFARSLVARANGEPVPTDGYSGAYLDEIVAEVLSRVPTAIDGEDAQVKETFRSVGVELMFSEIKQSLHDFGVDFDVYFHENHLYETGAVSRAIEQLRARGHVYEHDGAVWLRSTTFGDDKDRVIVKSDGQPAYISGDFAYYLDKRERGFQRVIIMLGADHHGYIGRMMAMCQAFGDVPGENLEILIGQMVNLVQSGKPVRMSKRAGNVVTLEDLVDAVGVDAARYAIARSSSDSMLDIDLDLLVKRSNDNPVYYVQYAHARICSLLKHASELKIALDITSFQPALLNSEREGDLLRALGDFPKVVLSAAELREPHRIARYLEELATAYHKFYDVCRVLPRGDEAVTDVTAARLILCSATRQVLANGLEQLGVTAPERM